MKKSLTLDQASRKAKQIAAIKDIGDINAIAEDRQRFESARMEVLLPVAEAYRRAVMVEVLGEEVEANSDEVWRMMTAEELDHAIEERGLMTIGSVLGTLSQEIDQVLAHVLVTRAVYAQEDVGQYTVDGMSVEKTEGVPTPPDSEGGETLTGSGSGLEEKKFQERFAAVLWMLEEKFNLTRSDCQISLGEAPSDNPEGISRIKSYVSIYIPALNRIIELCDEVGNTTFVLLAEDKSDIATYQAMKKSEKQDLIESDAFGLSTEIPMGNNYLREIEKALLKKRSQGKKETAPKRNSEKWVWDLSLETIRSDLRKFAAQVSGIPEEDVTDEHLKGLTTENISSQEIQCQNKKWNTKGQSYLSNIAVALGLSATSAEGASCMGVVLKLLKERVGCRERNVVYFKHPENIRLDLRNFAVQAFGIQEEEVTDENVQALSVNNIASQRIQCQNKEGGVNGQTYLKGAAVVLGLCKKKSEGTSYKSLVLKMLKERAGYRERGAVYFERPENVRADLRSFASQVLGIPEEDVTDEHVQGLNTDNISVQRIRCQNKEDGVSGTSYLKNAAVALGLCGTATEGRSYKRFVLKMLKERVGYRERDAVYFENPENIKADLRRFAAQVAGVPEKEVTDAHVQGLSTSNIASERIQCQNKEGGVGGGVYLKNSAVALGLCGTATEGRSYKRFVLKILKERSGYPVITWPDAENIKSDLRKFAAQVAGIPVEAVTDAHVQALTTKNIVDQRIQRQNKEGEIQGPSYLSNAAVDLGLCTTVKGGDSHRGLVLKVLKERAGYRERDAVYFEDPENIKSDLRIFAAQVAGVPEEEVTDAHVQTLSTENFQSKRIQCQNKEDGVSGTSYLKNAAVALGLCGTSTDGQSYKRFVLKMLKERVGYRERDAVYFENPENIKADLRRFAAQVAGISVEEVTDAHVQALSTKNIKSKRIQCQNKEGGVRGMAYLSQAAVDLGLCTTAKEGSSYGGLVLKMLKERVGYRERDAVYFEDPENIKADLRSLAAQVVGVPEEEVTDAHVQALNTNNIQSKRIQCQNKEDGVNGLSYLKNAAVDLGLCATVQEGASYTSLVLKLLKDRAGVMSFWSA